MLACERAVFNRPAVVIAEHLAAAEELRRDAIHWHIVFGGLHARANHLGLIIASEEALGLAGRRDSYRPEIGFEEGARLQAIKLSGIARARAHLEQRAIDRPRRPHRL